MIDVPKVIKTARLALKLTPEDFADKFGYTVQATIKWERGTSVAPYEVLNFALDTLHISLNTATVPEICDKCNGAGLLYPTARLSSGREGAGVTGSNIHGFSEEEVIKRRLKARAWYRDHREQVQAAAKLATQRRKEVENENKQSESESDNGGAREKSSSGSESVG